MGEEQLKDGGLDEGVAEDISILEVQVFASLQPLL